MLLSNPKPDAVLTNSADDMRIDSVNVTRGIVNALLISAVFYAITALAVVGIFQSLSSLH